MTTSRSFFPGLLALLVSGVSIATCDAQTEPPTRLLTVASMPHSGVNVTVTPSDLTGASGGSTGFSRQYPNGTFVTLTAPTSVAADSFVKWQRDGVDFTTSTSAEVTLNQDWVMTAVYFANNQVLTNGSFEADFQGWVGTGNRFIQSETPYTATDGTKLVSFNGTALSDEEPNGVLSQTFATIPGTTYALTFDMGVIGTNPAEQKLGVTVDGVGNLLTRTVSKFSVGTFTSQWDALSYAFVANSTATTLTFNDLSTVTDGVDLLLDDVRVAISSSGAMPAAPVAVNDAATMHTGQKVRLNVLGNDTGLIDPNTLTIVSPPATGTATVVSPGEILYTHSGTSIAPVSFTYRIAGEGGQSQPATVNITISSSLRIPNSTLNVPAAPPPTAVHLVPAYPGVSFSEPICFVSTPGDTNRLFVCERGGKIKVIPDVTAPTPTSSLVIDLAQVVAARAPAESWDPGAYQESGLLGMAIHPDYATNGFFYVSYLVQKSGDSAALYQRLSRFTVPAAQISQPAPVADTTSELVLIEQRDREDGHNGSDLHFGADGYLYWVIGDEANANDKWNNGQRIDMNFFGAMLRIDVDKKPGNREPNAHPNPTAGWFGLSTTNSIPRDETAPGSGIFKARYSIPIDNPFLSTAQGGAWDGTFNGSAISAANLPYVRSEFWAVGLRSPWRFFIDEPTGEIWLGDVGQDSWEELHTITKAANCGWPYWDGLHPGPKTPPDGFTSIAPIYEYVHNEQSGDSAFKGNSVIGGVVYRGSRISGLTGAYIFGDHISGHIWALTRPGGVTTVERIAGQAGLTTFGVDPSNGDVLVSDYFGGRIMRLVEMPSNTGFPTKLSETRLFADLADLSPAPGVLPYSPNLTFWSDYALKRRWFIIPDATSTMTWSRDGLWTFPAGQIWVKHFDLETERGNPASPRRRIETRLLVKNDAGAYGVSYRWNEAGTDATLVGDGGEDFPIDITVSGTPYTQQWTIPSRTQCVTCHSAQAGYALSFNTRQLNQPNAINAFPGNQLDLLRGHGYFSNTPESSNLLPRHLRASETDYPLEARVRSYLAVNCAYCHAGPDGTAPSVWDGRHERTLDQTGLVNGATSQAGGAFKLIVPGDTAHSVVLQRMAAAGGFSQMPPLGSHEIDFENVALVAEWINQELPDRVNYERWRLETFASPDSADGEPSADPDHDGVSNRDEFLAGTLARSSSSFLRPTLTQSGANVFLDLSIPANRSVQVETSNDLTNWSLWDIPGNNGVALPAGDFTFTGPVIGSPQYFRLLIRER